VPLGGASRANSKRDLVTCPIRGFCALQASELEELAQRLSDLGAEVGTLEHDPHGGGLGLAFRDPDNIQLEFYASPLLA
jgi:hypothetical protein